MRSNLQNSRKPAVKQTKNPDSEFIETDFGDRTISKQNFSSIIALPRQALKNCGVDNQMKVNVKLVQSKKEKFLKLTPIGENMEEKE